MTAEPAPQAGFTRIAVSGTGWATGQTIVNKFATLFSTWIVARFLVSDEVGAASLAVVVTKFLCVLPPLNLGDVLISHGRRAVWLGPTAGRIAILTGLIITLGAVAASPAVASFYEQYPRGLFIGLLVVTGLRPLAEALQMRPLASMRMRFQNRSIALIEGLVQLGATVATVLLAISGVGAWSLVVPQIAAAGVKAVCFRSSARTSGASPAYCAKASRRVAVRRLRGEFLAAGGAQYMHSVVDTLPLLVLGRMVSESQTGLYAFAFNLAAQANTMVASQISSVLQPVLGRMKNDASRQISGYLRALRTLSALAVPVCLTQAAFGESLFALAFEPRWRPSATIFSILSLSESFFFAASPTMALLKAQGRFRTFLTWQAAQMVVSLLAFPLLAREAAGIGVAFAVTGMWAISLPIAVWLGIRQSGYTLAGAVRIFAAPWSTALPIATGGWIAASWVGQFGVWGHALALATLAPACLLAMLLATRISQPSVYHEAVPVITGVARKALERLRR